MLPFTFFKSLRDTQDDSTALKESLSVWVNVPQCNEGTFVSKTACEDEASFDTNHARASPDSLRMTVRLSKSKCQSEECTGIPWRKICIEDWLRRPSILRYKSCSCLARFTQDDSTAFEEQMPVWVNVTEYHGGKFVAKTGCGDQASFDTNHTCAAHDSLRMTVFVSQTSPLAGRT